MWNIIGAIAGVIGGLLGIGALAKTGSDESDQDKAAYDTLLMAFKAGCKKGAVQAVVGGKCGMAKLNFAVPDDKDIRYLFQMYTSETVCDPTQDYLVYFMNDGRHIALAQNQGKDCDTLSARDLSSNLASILDKSACSPVH